MSRHYSILGLNVKFCKKNIKNPKVLEKNAVIHREKKRKKE